MPAAAATVDGGGALGAGDAGDAGGVTRASLAAAGLMEARNSRNRAFSAPTTAAGPVSLKNQVAPPKGTIAPSMRTGWSAAPPARSATLIARPFAGNDCR